MRILLSALTAFAAISMLISHSAEAQVAKSGYTLPLSLVATIENGASTLKASSK
jgi:hypothetical protein